MSVCVCVFAQDQLPEPADQPLVTGGEEDIIEQLPDVPTQEPATKGQYFNLNNIPYLHLVHHQWVSTSEWAVATSFNLFTIFFSLFSYKDEEGNGGCLEKF